MPLPTRHAHDMLEVLSLPDGSGEVEVTEDKDGYIPLILCRNADGTVRWQAEPPDGEQDAWVSVQVEDGTVIARSWSCWAVTINAATGEEAQRHFTK